MIEFTHISNFVDLSNFWPLLRRSKWSNLQNLLIFFDLSTFRPLDMSYQYLVNFTKVVETFDLSTFWPLVRTSKCSILLNMLNFLTFRSLIGRLITEFHWIFWTFSTSRPFNLYFVGLNDWIYEYFEFVRPFDLSTSASKV